MARKIARKTVGVFSISAGLLFGFLPFVPGILLIIAGLEMLGYREPVWNFIKGKFGRAEKVTVASDLTL